MRIAFIDLQVFAYTSPYTLSHLRATPPFALYFLQRRFRSLMFFQRRFNSLMLFIMPFSPSMPRATPSLLCRPAVASQPCRKPRCILLQATSCISIVFLSASKFRVEVPPRSPAWSPARSFGAISGSKFQPRSSGAFSGCFAVRLLVQVRVSLSICRNISLLQYILSYFPKVFHRKMAF